MAEKTEKREKIKCGCCGKPLNLSLADKGVAKCQNCGEAFTLMGANLNAGAKKLISEAYRLMEKHRFEEAFSACEKAAGLAEAEPEAYFGMALANFRIKYAKDVSSKKPALRPVSFQGTDKKFSEDENYMLSLKYATEEQRAVYADKAKKIDAAIRGRIKKSKQEAVIEFREFTDDGNLSVVRKKQDLIIEDGVLKQVNSRDEEITIPEGVGKIGESAFKDCRNLKRVTIPNTVTHIGKEAFDFCCLLKDLVIPQSVKYIGRRAFVDCNSLQTITLPFVGTKINDRENARLYYLFGGTVESGKQYLPLSLKTVNVTGGEYIADNAFFNCVGLENINLPETCQSIGSYAFFGCTGIKTLIIPRNVTSIGNEAFSNCRSLEDIRFTGEVQTMGVGAFRNNLKMQKITLPQGLKEVSAECFYNCASLTEIGLQGVTKICQSAFAGCSSLKRMVLPQSVQTLGDNAFENCASIEEVVLSENLTEIGAHAFANCPNLKKIVLPSSLKSIGEGAFAGDGEITVCFKSQEKPAGCKRGWDLVKEGNIFSRKHCKTVFSYKD